MKKQFKLEVKNGFDQIAPEPKLINETDISHLPELVQKAKTIYHKPGGDFCYGEFCIDKIFYNVAPMSFSY